MEFRFPRKGAEFTRKASWSLMGIPPEPLAAIIIGEAFLFFGNLEASVIVHLLNILMCVMAPMLLKENPILWQSFSLVSMLRVLNLHSTLRSITETLQQRLDAAGLLQGMPPLVLTTDMGTCRLEEEEGWLHTTDRTQGGARVRMSQTFLTRLIMGYESVDAVQTHKSVTIPKRAEPYLRAMFPSGHPHCWNPDHF